jgi:hypothetical protein
LLCGESLAGRVAVGCGAVSAFVLVTVRSSSGLRISSRLVWRQAMNSKHDIVVKRCGCTRDDTGRQFAAVARNCQRRAMAAGITPCR